MTDKARHIVHCQKCDTRFYATHDQLDIADGQVRCGHCKHVFNAREQLEAAESHQGTLIDDLSFAIGQDDLSDDASDVDIDWLDDELISLAELDAARTIDDVDLNEIDAALFDDINDASEESNQHVESTAPEDYPEAQWGDQFIDALAGRAESSSALAELEAIETAESEPLDHADATSDEDEIAIDWAEFELADPSSSDDIQPEIIDDELEQPHQIVTDPAEETPESDRLEDTDNIDQEPSEDWFTLPNVSDDDESESDDYDSDAQVFEPAEPESEDQELTDVLVTRHPGETTEQLVDRVSNLIDSRLQAELMQESSNLDTVGIDASIQEHAEDNAQEVIEEPIEEPTEELIEEPAEESFLDPVEEPFLEPVEEETDIDSGEEVEKPQDLLEETSDTLFRSTEFREGAADDRDFEMGATIGFNRANENHFDEAESSEPNLAQEELNEQLHKRSFTIVWVVSSVLLLALLAAQYAWHKRLTWSQDPELRPHYLSACSLLNCELPTFYAPAQLQITDLVVEPDDVDGVLSIRFSIRNNAAFAQRTPNMTIVFSDLNDVPVIALEKSPGEDPNITDTIEGHQAIEITWLVADPGLTAPNYRVSLKH
ncbi:MAG: DUF3426 domain-containing protein [Gammaproteobacteria bacterium]|nr:DUF3426 domain-containing protein [Gammaproteobacteria bacterium]